MRHAIGGGDFLGHALTRKLGVVNSFRFGAVMFTTCIFTLPLIGRLAAYPTLLWPVFALQRVLDMVSGASCGGRAWFQQRTH